MDRNFRTQTYLQLLKNAEISSGLVKRAGLVSDLVNKSIDKTQGGSSTPSSNELKTNLITGINTGNSFKEKFLGMKPGLERENFILDEIKKHKPKLAMVPVTIDGPQGLKITYQVMPDYITIDGIRVPMAGQTAQKVADLYGMNLPTSKMSNQIWEAADTKIRPPPLSGGGTIGGKHYSGKEVVQHKISDSDSAVQYSDMIQQEIAGHPNATLVAGHMKDLVQPEGSPDKLGLYGWHGKDGKPLQYSAQTPHDTSVHSEYGAGVRLVDSNVTIKTPDGRIIPITLDRALNSPLLAKYLSSTQKSTRYNIK